MVTGFRQLNPAILLPPGAFATKEGRGGCMSDIPYASLNGRAPSRSLQPVPTLRYIVGLAAVGLGAFGALKVRTMQAFGFDGGTHSTESTLHLEGRENARHDLEPGPPGPLLVNPSNRSRGGPTSLFFYAGLFDEPGFTSGSTQFDGYIFGTRLFYVNASSTSSRRTSVAVPTGRPDETLRGRLLVWPQETFLEKLALADRLVGYDPSHPALNQDTALRRSVISVFRKDGTKTKAYWYFQGAVEEETRRKELAELKRIVADELASVQAAERKFGITRRVKRQPTMIVTYGSPGSGKSTVVKTYLDIEGLPTQDAWIDCNIDRLIASYDKSVPVLQKLTMEQCTRCHGGNIDDKLRESEDDECHPSIEKWLHRRANEIYENAVPRLGRVHDQLIETAFQKSQNILFETSGSREIGLVGLGGLVWAASAAKQKGYKVVLLYPVVSSHLLYERIKNRACDTGQIPIPEEVSRRNAANALHNFKKLILPSAAVVVDEIVLWDNNKPPPEKGPVPMLALSTTGMPCRELTKDDSTEKKKSWNLMGWAATLNDLAKQKEACPSKGTADGQTKLRQILDFVDKAT
eukprot:g10556.t1